MIVPTRAVDETDGIERGGEEITRRPVRRACAPSQDILREDRAGKVGAQGDVGVTGRPPPADAVGVVHDPATAQLIVRGTDVVRRDVVAVDEGRIGRDVPVRGGSGVHEGVVLDGDVRRSREIEETCPRIGIASPPRGPDIVEHVVPHENARGLLGDRVIRVGAVRHDRRRGVPHDIMRERDILHHGPR